MGEVYSNELFGSYFEDPNHESDWGLLSHLSVDFIAPFVNSYCAHFTSPPSEEDRVLRYLKEDRILGNPLLGNLWCHPSIMEQSRKLMEKWVLRKDFFVAFDKILEYRERRDYWVKWLNAGKIDSIRLFAPDGEEIKKRYDIDHEVQSLDLPTVYMKIGNCIAIECGIHGKGGLYVYPTDGPLEWDMKVNNPRNYKAPILDLPYGEVLPRGWQRFSHTWNWQNKVSNYMRKVYSLTY